MTDVEISQDITTKVVSLVVAIVVFACVLVPVCEAMSDEGGGGGGEGERIVLNTFESSIGVDLTPFNSYQLYFSDMTPTLPNEITYTLEDLNEIKSKLVSHSEELYELTNSITILEVFDESRSGVSISYYGYDGDVGISIMNNGSGGGIYLSHVTSFNLTITTDYQLDCSYTSEYPPGSSPHTESVQTTVTEIQQLSESEDGWMDVSWDLHNDKISVGSEVILWGYIESLDKGWYKNIIITEGMISNSHLQFTIDWEDGYTSDVDLGLQSTDMAGVWKFTDAFYEWFGTIKDNGVEIDPEDAYCEVSYFSTFGYTQSGSGSGTPTGSNASGSGNGTANTLVGIIPVFVALALILYILGMFYTPNRIE